MRVPIVRQWYTLRSSPTGLNTPTEGQKEPCEGQMIPIWQAEAALGDLAEIERVRSAYGVERVDGLREAVKRWHDLGEPRPDGPVTGVICPRQIAVGSVDPLDRQRRLYPSAWDYRET